MHCSYTLALLSQQVSLVCTRVASLCYVSLPAARPRNRGWCCRMKLCAQVKCSLTSELLSSFLVSYLSEENRAFKSKSRPTTTVIRKRASCLVTLCSCFLPSLSLCYSFVSLSSISPKLSLSFFFLSPSHDCRAELCWITTGSRLAQRQDHLSAQKHPQSPPHFSRDSPIHLTGK